MARRAPAGALRLLFGAGICAVLRTAGQSKVKRRTLACTLWLGALYSYPVAPGFRWRPGCDGTGPVLCRVVKQRNAVAKSSSTAMARTV